ncbi:hypothetical protein BGZ50_005757 [Haplosporangium sp. Z 11]|nr:hypothetical protein BGZ50_005757 [Haplosporangium sp. Z 11]
MISLDFLIPNETFGTQIGAIYCLYMVYFTQPTLFRKTPIQLTVDAWQRLEHLYQAAFECDATDLIYVIHKLRDRNAFLYVAQVERTSKELKDVNVDLRERLERSLIRMEKKATDNPLVPIKPLLQDLSSMTLKYHDAKVDLVSLSLAERASVLVLNQLKKKELSEIDIRTVKPVPAFLGAEPKSSPSTISTAYNNVNTNRRNTLRNADKNADGEGVSVTFSETSAEPPETVAVGAEPSIGVESMSVPAPIPTDSGFPRESVASCKASPMSTLPSIFTLSMLQASTAVFPVVVEDKIREFYRNRMSRFEFAAAGNLPMNSYRFPRPPPVSYLLRNTAAN